MGRTLPSRFAVFTPTPSGTAYAVVDAGGTVLSEGTLQSGSAFAFLADAYPVVADYALLPELAALVAPDDGRLGILPPSSVPSGDAAAVASAWLCAPESERRHLSAQDLTELEPLLRTRAVLTRTLANSLDEIAGLITTVSPRYLALVSDDRGVSTHFLPVVREFPTLQALAAGASGRLPHALQLAATGPSALAASGPPFPSPDALLRFARSLPPPDPASCDAEEWIAGTLLPGTVDRHAIMLEQRLLLDAAVHDFPVRQRDRSNTGPLPRGFAVLSSAAPPVPDLATAGTPELLARAETLLERRSSPARRPSTDFQEFRLIHAALNEDGGRLDGPQAVRLETIGQLLALSAVEFDAAVRHRSACDALLTSLPVTMDASHDLTARHRADAVIAMAISAACALDVATAVPSLRAVYDSTLSSDASPALRSELAGLFALALTFFGEHGGYPQAWDDARIAQAATELDGPTRAPLDIGELFLAANDLSRTPEEVELLRHRADESSRGTVYRYYFHYVVMLASYITADFERGIRSYFDINAEGVWPQFNYRMENLTQRAYAMHLAAHGDLGAARRELGRVHFEPGVAAEEGGRLHQGLMRLRLDLAVGDDRGVLSATLPNGEYGENRMTASRVHRYLPLSLMLRGTALSREGDADLAATCFLRATHQAAMTGEWFLLCAAETPEYRAWLQAHDPERLPAGLSRAIHEALLRRPLFIRATLPRLTPQQTRILPLLAQGRSVDSIAAELHITRNTMKSHLRRLYERLGARSREQAVLRARAYGVFG